MSEPIDDPADLLTDYCTGGLLSEDERALLASAATDQNIFDQLMEAEALRDALSSPEQRNRLKNALQAWEGSAQPQCAGDCEYLEESVPSGALSKVLKTVQPPITNLVELKASASKPMEEHWRRPWYASPRIFAIAAGIMVCLAVPFTAMRWMQSSIHSSVNTTVGQLVTPGPPDSPGANKPVARPGENSSPSGAETDAQTKKNVKSSSSAQQTEAKTSPRDHAAPPSNGPRQPTSGQEQPVVNSPAGTVAVARNLDRGCSSSGKPLSASACATAPPPPETKQAQEEKRSEVASNSPSERKEPNPPGSPDGPTQVADARPKESEVPSVDTRAPSGGSRLSDLTGINIDIPRNRVTAETRVPDSSSPGNPRPTPPGNVEQPAEIARRSAASAAWAAPRSTDLVRAEAWGFQPVVVEQLIGPANYAADSNPLSCGGNNDAAQILSTAAALLSRSDVGFAGALPAIQNARTPAFLGQGVISEMLARSGDQSIPCHPLIAVIPAGSRIVGFRYSARDGVAGEQPCTLDGNGWYVCGIGYSMFFGPPTVTPAGKSLLVTGVFKNWSSDRQRAANMTIYYQPGQ